MQCCGKYCCSVLVQFHFCWYACDFLLAVSSTSSFLYSYAIGWLHNVVADWKFIFLIVIRVISAKFHHSYHKSISVKLVWDICVHFHLKRREFWEKNILMCLRTRNNDTITLILCVTIDPEGLWFLMAVCVEYFRVFDLFLLCFTLLSLLSKHF